jgi:4'-phosphopantetheinyl transferase
VDLLRFAERFFSAGELAALRSLPPDGQLDAFFRCWTRKEAYLKACGEGLSRDLKSFDVSLIPGEPACLLATRPDPVEAMRWCLVSLDPGPAAVAAVAIEVLPPADLCREWLRDAGAHS